MVIHGRYRLLVLFFGLAIFVVRADAEDTTLPRADVLADRLGWTVPDAYDQWGAPENLFSFRGAVPEEDNVVFFYPDHLYLFWFRNRVWQVRADDRWTGELDGVRMGMNRDEVEALWGDPINDFDAEPTWTLPDRGYPVRIRLYFDDSGALIDAYVYRSDW